MDGLRIFMDCLHHTTKESQGPRLLSSPAIGRGSTISVLRTWAVPSATKCYQDGFLINRNFRTLSRTWRYCRIPHIRPDYMVPQRYIPEMRTEKKLHPVFFQDIVDLIIRSFDGAYTLHIYRKLHYLIIYIYIYLSSSLSLSYMNVKLLLSILALLCSITSLVPGNALITRTCLALCCPLFFRKLFLLTDWRCGIKNESNNTLVQGSGNIHLDDIEESD